MAFTAKDVQALREKTGCGMMDCKKALTECDGDMDKAVDFLREKGLAVASKKASRIAAEGVVDCYIDDDTAVIIEVNSETDFVAKNEKFQSFVKDCAKTIAKNNPASVEALLELKIEGDDMSVADALKDKIYTIGENMNIRRFEVVKGTVASYIHGGGRIGVLVNLESDASDKEALLAVGKELGMQVAAMNPTYISPETIPAAELEKEKAIQISLIKNDEKNAKKPENIIEKMVVGKMNKFYESACLLNQIYFRDGDISIAKFLENKGKELGAEIKVKSFIRYEKGEGLQKREDDFAAEVAGMAKGN